MRQKLSKTLVARLLIVAGCLISAAGVVNPTAHAAATKITICHRTHSTTNPYRRITVSQNAVTRNAGHKDHTGSAFDPTYAYPSNAKNWGDIIPDATAGGSNSIKQNYTGAGYAMYNGTSYNGYDYSGKCGNMTAKQFYDTEIAAGVPSADILQDLEDQMANEDYALLQALGGTFLGADPNALENVKATTNAATNIGDTSGDLNGVLEVGGTTTVSGFEWSYDPTFATYNSTSATPSSVTGTTSVTTTLTGLTPGSTVYFRVVGTTNQGTDLEGVIRGDILNFTLPVATTTTTTVPASSTTTTSTTSTTTTVPASTTTTSTTSTTTTSTTSTTTTVPASTTTTSTTSTTTTVPASTTTSTTSTTTTVPASTTTTSTTVPTGTTTTSTTSTTTTVPASTTTTSTTVPATTTTSPAGDGTARVLGIVWIDANRNGVQDKGEPGIANAPVRLEQRQVAAQSVRNKVQALSAIYTTTTDAKGAYLFEHVPAGAWVVRATLSVSGLDKTYDSEGLTDWSVDVVVPMGGEARGDFAAAGNASLEGALETVDGTPLEGTAEVVWAGEDGIPGSADDIVFEVPVKNGQFSVSGLPVGSYTVSGVSSDGRAATDVSVQVKLGVNTAELVVDDQLPDTGGRTREALLLGIFMILGGVVLLRRRDA